MLSDRAASTATQFVGVTWSESYFKQARRSAAFHYIHDEQFLQNELTIEPFALCPNLLLGGKSSLPRPFGVGLKNCNCLFLIGFLASKKLAFKVKKKLQPPRINWAELLRRTFLEDVLKCPCGGTRRIVAVVKDSDEAMASLKRMGVELPPTRIREREPPPLPPDRQLRLAV